KTDTDSICCAARRVSGASNVNAREEFAEGVSLTCRFAHASGAAPAHAVRARETRARHARVGRGRLVPPARPLERTPQLQCLHEPVLCDRPRRLVPLAAQDAAD